MENANSDKWWRPDSGWELDLRDNLRILFLEARQHKLQRSSSVAWEWVRHSKSPSIRSMLGEIRNILFCALVCDWVENFYCNSTIGTSLYCIAMQAVRTIILMRLKFSYAWSWSTILLCMTNRHAFHGKWTVPQCYDDRWPADGWTVHLTAVPLKLDAWFMRYLAPGFDKSHLLYRWA